MDKTAALKNGSMDNAAALKKKQQHGQNSDGEYDSRADAE